MGLYINQEHHQNVFKTKEEIKAPQQAFYRRDHLSDLMNEQKTFNATIEKSLNKLHMLGEQQHHMQSFQWNETIRHLQDIYQQHEERDTSPLLKTLEEQIDLLTLNHNDHKQQIHVMTKSYDELLRTINSYNDQYKHLCEQIDNQMMVQKRIVNDMAEQENIQKKLDKRLENQEALTEKMIRQIDHLRSIVFERVNYLADKIDTMYKDTSSYMSQLMSRSILPLSNYMMFPQKDSNKKSSQQND